ncbi:MAG: thiamine-phosphate kinase [Actinomycetota bacterium]
MRVADEGEFGIIARLRGMLEGGRDGLVRGIGDDTAVFRSPAGGLWAYTADAVVEGVHFDPSYTSWHSLGYKALAVNVSDLASMGGCPPAFALVVLGLAAETEVEAVEELYRGLRDCGDEFGCGVVGGDIVRSPSGMFISVSLVGRIPGETFLTRGGAREGQTVMVTGTLGDSFLGLRWLMDGHGGDNECARRHLYPRPRLEEGRRAGELGATAAIDISDGLLRDLGHICEESGVGAEVMLEKIPISDPATNVARQLGEDAAGAALYGGEDYELILVADPGRVDALRAELGLSAIGRITPGEGVRVLDASGRPVDIGRSGYEHFKEG